MKKENIFISWHYTTHGIAYLKHVLSAFYRYNDINIYKQNNLTQEDMNKTFSIEQGERFIFDKVYYLSTPQKTFDKLSLRRFDYIDNIIKKDVDIQNDDELFNVWKDLIDIRKEHYKKHKKTISLKEEINFVKNKHKHTYKKWEKSLWRDMHHYSIEEQIYWFGKISNAKKYYKNGSSFIKKTFDIDNLRNTLKISKKIIPFINELKEKHPNANFTINVSLGSNETQVVWHVLSELNILPHSTTLIQSYDNKEKKSVRFKPFLIKKIPNKILTEISSQVSLYNTKVKSESRKLAELKMKHYIKYGFAILLLGERGIGKTRIAESYNEYENFISVNCASFTNNLIAESILFGHKKGSFTGANEDKKGVFIEANKGVLFLDEIHHLDKLTQAKLMKALQTDENNNFTIRPVGGNQKDTKKISLTIILASNINVKELKNKLLPDFYDRVTQLVIELPPLRESIDDLQQELEIVWKQMKFNSNDYREIVEKDKKLSAWLKKLKLYGNYRDLQKITIFYNSYLRFDSELLKLIPEKNAFYFTKNQFEKYISIGESTNSVNEFSSDKKAEDLIDEFKSKLANWAINKFHGAPNAAAHFKSLGGKTTAPTLYNWCKIKVP